MISTLIRQVNLNNLDTMGKHDEIHYVYYEKEDIRAHIGSILHAPRQYWIFPQDDGKFRLEIRLEKTTSWGFLPVGIFDKKEDAEKIRKVLRKHDPRKGKIFDQKYFRESAITTLNINEMCSDVREVVFTHLRKRYK